MAGAKTIVMIENHSFHARQPREGIFEIRSHWCCFYNFWPELQMAVSIPGDEIFIENW